MKRLFFLTVFSLILQLSCEKSASDSVVHSLAGEWKMIVVKDNATNISTTKPASIQGDVIIFVIPHNATSGSFSGQTPTNQIMQNDFTIGENGEIAILALSMTKVSETTWGSLFVDHIRDAERYTLEPGNMLHIRTPLKTLSFRKT
jgi:hypothetical protein